MSYAALYRKFRPSCFGDVKGQDHIVTTLKNQIIANRIGHAYLLCGTRGTGKTTVAKLMAKSANCENAVDGSPCGTCSSCMRIAAGASMDVIEIDAASNNGVDNIRDIVDQVSYSPAEGKYKVYIIDEVHMLTVGAFNALLKTLEEPPSYVIFILATTEVHKIPVTILSRCQRYDFKRITLDTIVERLKEIIDKEEVLVEDRALRYIGKNADGAMRDALSLLDQCLAFHFGEELTYEMVLEVLGAVDTSVFSRLFGYIAKRNVLSCIELIEEVIVQGRELSQFIVDFTWYLRNVLLIQTSDHSEDVIDMSKENMLQLEKDAKLVESASVIRYIRVFSEVSNQIKYASQKRIVLEMAMIKLCRPEMEVAQDALLERIRILEEKMATGVVVSTEEVKSGKEVEQANQKKKELPSAIPADIQQVIAGWNGILQLASGSMRPYLKNAKLSLGKENELLIVVPDGIISDYFVKHEDSERVIQDMIIKAIGKQVKVTIRVLEEKEEFEMSYVDLSTIIKMNIDEE